VTQKEVHWAKWPQEQQISHHFPLGFSWVVKPNKQASLSLPLRKEERKMATKNLIRAGASLMNRLIISKNPILHPNAVSTHQTLTPHLFPSSVSNFQPTDFLSITKLAVANQDFLHPSGLPSLEFFLPDGTLLIYYAFLIYGFFSSSRNNFTF
jgi:hypothetical protein